MGDDIHPWLAGPEAKVRRRRSCLFVCLYVASATSLLICGYGSRFVVNRCFACVVFSRTQDLFMPPQDPWMPPQEQDPLMPPQGSLMSNAAPPENHLGLA